MSVWYSGEATISQGGTDVGVECEIYAHQEMIEAGDELIEGLRSWDGTWWNPDPQYALQPGEAAIRLDDGREGQILVSHLNIGLPGGERGTLTGNGALPS